MSTDSKARLPENGWTWVDNLTVDHIHEVGPVPFAVYVVLARHADVHRQCYPSGATITKKTGLTKRTVWTAVQRLETAGWILVDRSRSGAGSSQPNRYTLLPSGPGETNGITPEGGEAKSTTPGEAKSVRVVKQRAPKQETVNKTQKQDSPDLELAHWMFRLIQQLQPNRKAPNFDSWADTIRLMRKRDNRSLEDIRDLFGRVNRDEFWRVNVLSPEKLRTKWDDLDLKLRINGTEKTHNTPPKSQPRGKPHVFSAAD